MNFSKKAQASMEFITMLGIVMLIFIGLFAIGNYQGSSAFDLRVKLHMQDVCDKFATASNVVSSGGDGFNARLTLPSNIDGKNYIIRVVNRTASLSLNKKVVFCRLTTKDFTYLNETDPIPRGKELLLRNKNGTIQVG